MFIFKKFTFSKLSESSRWWGGRVEGAGRGGSSHEAGFFHYLNVALEL